ncbi:hypothetical protein [Sulfuricurvum sp.]|uniref:hypothetical protein n=1 Tax=Sulfuricurvum sp. TaxID=2025608 RepID=UPI002D2EF39E|nr:hypothetical protein [Sulfuricurvum sp.]HZF70086.1 hypothetical protein [Sulfuricurvum sp.]
MKKFLLLIPVGLLAATGVFWFTAEKNIASIQNAPSNANLPHGSQELFTESERSLRQIVRHGDEQSIQKLNASLEAINTELLQRQKQGFAVKDIEAHLSQYKHDSMLLSDKFTPYLKQLHQYDLYEETHEKSFMTAIEQIGLYELKTSYEELGKLRTDYIKEPSDTTKLAYETQLNKVTQIITELYLDSTIDKPLFDYLTNHKHYFETIDTAYNEIGFERIHQLRTNGYAIKTGLQLLPTL